MTGIVCPLESRVVMVGVSVCFVAMHGCTAVGKRDCGEALDLRQSETQSPYRLNRQSDYWLGAHSLLCGAVACQHPFYPTLHWLRMSCQRRWSLDRQSLCLFCFLTVCSIFCSLKETVNHNWKLLHLSFFCLSIFLFCVFYVYYITHWITYMI